MSLITIGEALDEKGDEFIEAVVVGQQRRGMRASGRSAASLRKEVSQSGHIHTLRILGKAYFYQQQNGRRPSNKKPSRAMVESLREWIKIRGLGIPPYALAMKIQRDGIKVPNRFNSGGVLDPLKPDRVRSILKPFIRPILIESAKSTFFK
ncbi:hypothetical protein [Spirosoma agri]|uniref:Uncharacterized protein n=1 Tax=Spirosoma agri TaxID=1987381 RepID=A0A6M0IJE1_9BACT|nr:hypothetical protein [Spirosoma agri]NEU67942.1 hypothetical protein [Spirosoma agri]